MPRSGLTGDFGTLDAWVKKIEKAGGGSALRALSNNLAEEALSLVAEGFAKEQDPYGKAWAPKRIPDGRQVLVGRTARLRRGWHRKSVTPTRFVLAPSVDYAKYQQNGRGRIFAKPGKVLAFPGPGGRTIFRKSVGPAPARRMVPLKGRLPSAWKRAFVDTAREFFATQFR